MNTQPLFEIEEVRKNPRQIIVYILHKDGEQSTVKVFRNEFEKWLEDSDRLNWENNDREYRGEHIQQGGKIPIWVYWEEYQTYHAKDMYDFLLVSKIGFERLMKGVYDGIESICKDYQN